MAISHTGLAHSRCWLYVTHPQLFIAMSVSCFFILNTLFPGSASLFMSTAPVLAFGRLDSLENKQQLCLIAAVCSCIESNIQ